MKRLKKYQADNENISVDQMLMAYRNQVKSVISEKSILGRTPKVNSPLASLVPMAAASLTPFALVAQCGVGNYAPSPSVNANSVAGTVEITVDIDGDGVDDFQLDGSDATSSGEGGALSDLFIIPLGNAEVSAYSVGGGFFYVNRLNAGDAITSADSDWRAVGDLPGYATLDFQGGGPWHGTGVETGYVAVRIDGNKLGFMEVTWDNTTATITVNPALTGVQNDISASNTSIAGGAGACGILPIDLAYFDVSIKGGNTMLKWTTASEINNEGFEVQRSIDGKEFRKVGWVEGQGNSSAMIDYRFEDNSIQSNEQYYYRLKQVDFDGKFSFSETKAIMNKDLKNFILSDISPNPITNGYASIKITTSKEETVSIVCYDAMGAQMINKQQVIREGINVIPLDLSELSNGLHFVKVDNGVQSTFKKIFVQHN